MYQAAKSVSGGIVSVPPTKQPAVLSSLDSLAQITDRLDKTINMLQDRLTSILETQAVTGTKTSQDKIVSEGYGIAHRIQVEYNNIERLGFKLQDIISRLEV